AALAAPAAHRLHARDDDLVDVQEAVLLEADVHEGGLQAGEDVVHAALVDVAHDRAGAAALQVELGDAIAASASALLTTLDRGLGRRGPRRLHQRHAGLSPVDADQHLLSHLDEVLSQAPTQDPIGCMWWGPKSLEGGHPS